MAEKIVKSQNKGNEFNVLLWNVNCASGSGNGNTSLLPILDEIDIYNEDVKPDVMILNEFYKHDDYSQFKQELEDAGYRLFDDLRKRKLGVNQVFIALSNRIKDAEIIGVFNPNEKNCDKMPNFLSVILQYKEKRIAIIGIRIQCATGSKFGSKADYQSRGKEFDEFLNYIRELQQEGIEDILIGADLNNARILGDENELYDEKEIQEKYKNKKGEDVDQKDYHNYHLIKLKASRMGLKLITPKNINRSCGNIPSLKIDHFLVSESLVVSNEKYEFKEGSDHAVLTATINI